MKYIKLFFISIIVFGVMLFFISLLFPSTTIVSRAVNVNATRGESNSSMTDLHNLVFGNATGAKIPTQPDTFLTTSAFASNIQEGVAVYKLTPDTTTIQTFYRIHVPWYQPWNKFGLMLNETKYGPPLDSAIKRIEEGF